MTESTINGPRNGGQSGAGAARVPAQGSRAALWTKRIAQVAAVLGVIALIRLLPAGQAMEALAARVDQLGAFAPFAFIALYALVTISMLPASVLSLAAGALFGLATGTVTVAAGATLGMAATFLIARYLARPAVERRFARSPRFAAIDRAVGQGGWKIVALLRLSPAVPFNLQNYLYGLTAIRFWPCILASAIAILPGTFMYVYLGYASRASLGALAGAETGRGPAQWTMLVVGLAATVAVTVYVTKLARAAIQEQDTMPSEAAGKPVPEPAPPARNPWIAAGGNALVAALILAVAATMQCQPQWLTGLFGPPAVTLGEAYAAREDGPPFDHAPFDKLLKQYVNEEGGVDYAGLEKDSAALGAYTAAIAGAPFDSLGRDEKLTLLINAYNAFTLELITEWRDQGITSIREIPADKRWDAVRWTIGGTKYSLNQIEHEQVRPNFKEPNIHFALVCAAVGCPPLRKEAYSAARLGEQLADQARIVHTDGSRWYRLDAVANTVHLTKLYDWYGGDFEQVAGGVLPYAARYASGLAGLLEAGKKPSIEWLDYDWALNNQENLN